MALNRQKVVIAALCSRGLIGAAFFAKLAPLADDSQLGMLLLISVWWFLPYIVYSLVAHRAKDGIAIIGTAIGVICLDAALHIDYLREPAQYAWVSGPIFVIVPVYITLSIPLLYMIVHLLHRAVNRLRTR